MFKSACTTEISLDRLGLWVDENGFLKTLPECKIRTLTAAFQTVLNSGCSDTCMNDVTQLLGAIDHGDPEAAGKLLPLVYQELRKLAAHKMAGQAPGHTLRLSV
jgi:hypothetical protein